MTDEDKAAWEKHIKDRTRDGWAVFGDPLIFQAGRDSKPSNDWVKDIPDEWKDGRPVDLYIIEKDKKPYRLNDCRYITHGATFGFSMWKSWNYRLPADAEIYAMLPPQPPQQEPL